MKRFINILFLSCIAGLSLAQEMDDRGMRSNDDVKGVAERSIETNGDEKTEELKSDIQHDISDVKVDAGNTKEDVKKATKSSIPVKGAGKEDIRTAVEENADGLQYDSDDPESAPWKKKSFSGADPGDLQIPSGNAGGTASSLKEKSVEYAAKVKDIHVGTKPGKAMAGSASGKIKATQNFGHLMDSISSLKEKGKVSKIQETLLDSKRIYSDKYKKKVYDSLGVDKADSLFQVASTFVKTETPKEELISKINSRISRDQMKGVGLNKENESLSFADADKLGSLPDQVADADIGTLKLPDSLLSELPPITGRQLDSKYMGVIDSLRNIALKAKNQSLDEQQVTKDLKRTAMREKPRFLDKIYFEGILGFVNDTTYNILQISPALGYHFTEFLSVGAGPHMLLQFQEKRLNVLAGFRTFVKAEIWKQRLYLQVEDNVSKTKVDSESIRRIAHNVLAGGGGLLPISRSLAINIAVLYRINEDISSPGRSPWVVRVGISSIKKRQP